MMRLARPPLIALVLAPIACAPAAASPSSAPRVALPTVASASAAPLDAGAAPAASSVSPAVAFDPAPWLQDLDALVAELSSHYANLDYAVHERRMDLAAVKQTAVTRIRAATSDDQAERAFNAFLRAFGDGHLGIDFQPEHANAPGVPATGPLCQRKGYDEHDRPGVDFTHLGGFTAVADADAPDVPGGVFEVPGGGKLGVIRIGLFMEAMHPALCEAARASLNLADDAVCDDACGDRLAVAVANLLTAALERRVTSLARAGVAAIAVDITANGGGSDWVEPAARVLTKVRIPTGAFGAVRHAHWVTNLEEMRHDLEADLAAHGDFDGGVLAAGIATLTRELAEVSTPCDQTALWQEGQPKPSCTQLVHLSSLLPYAKPGELAGRATAEDLFGPSRYAYDEGANTLPLVVLVDSGTASAAEHFAEMLQDNHAALVMGAVTLGAGCGFTNGGIPTVLPRSHARVRIPDCARFRADGTNAVAGVTPDVVLPLLDRDSPYQRAVKIEAGLESAWRRIVTQRLPAGSAR